MCFEGMDADAVKSLYESVASTLGSEGIVGETT